MSNYRDLAFNPENLRIEEADFRDNWFGPHVYGVTFGGSQVYHTHEVDMRAASAAMEKMRDTLKWLDRKGGLGLDVHERIQTALSSQEREKS